MPSPTCSATSDELTHERFERFARETPDAIAARHGARSLTYGELDRLACELALHLAESGVSSEHKVAVCLPPSLDVLVAMLAIFKAGGVYVPLDPTLPPALLALILEETQPTLVLTHAAVVEKVRLEHRAPLCLDREWPSRASTPAVLPSRSPVRQLDQTAYVLYTSGTTGQPKGVVASHRNLAHYLTVARERFGFGPSDVYCALARTTFSISFFELLSPLTTGGQVILLDRDDVLDPQRLTSVLTEVTVLHAGPSLLGNLFRYLRAADPTRVFANVRHASSGGDLVPAHLLEQMKSVFAQAELFVIYGCTEISCMGTTFEVSRALPVATTLVGRPFPGVTVRVLDETHDDVAVGEVGEVSFAGPGVTRRYLAQPELTSQRFVCLDGQRFYRTGDLGRMNADGDLELLGRSDFQVQLRGIRIELTGIEQTVLRLGLAKQCAVTTAARDEHDVRLVALVVEPRESELAAFRKLLATQLPDYMLPQGLIVLDALPVTHNGKLDRARLREHALSAATVSRARRAPQSSTECVVATAFASVLGVADVGLEDDFFDLGGHSLSCVLLTEVLQNKLGLAVSPGLLFEHSTVGALARTLEGSFDTTQRPILLSQTDDKPALFMLLGVHIYRELAAQLKGDYSVYGVYAGSELKLFDGSEAPSVTDLAQDYVSLIKRQQPAGPYHLGGLSFGGIVAYEVAQLLEAEGHEVEQLVLIDSVLPDSNLAKVRRLSSLPGRDIVHELQQRVRAHWSAQVDGVHAHGLAKQHEDAALRSLEARRQAVYESASRAYMRSIRRFGGPATLVVAGERLQSDRLLDPRCGFGALIPGLVVRELATSHLGLLEAPHVSQLARIILGRESVALAPEVCSLRSVA